EAGRYTHADVLGESPTSVELKDRLREFFRDADRRPDDYVVVYLTGHGAILDDEDFVVLASDADPSDLWKRSVPAGEIVRMALADTQARRLLLLLDTCYSGQGGEDMTREALRRIGEPRKRVHDQEKTSEGSGVVVVAASRPFERALPGTFTAALDRAARSPATVGSAVPTLRIGTLIGAIQADEERPRSQTSVWHQLGMTKDEPSFILNPQYRQRLVGADLLEQERARYAEQRADQLRDRFVPAAKWFTGRHAALADLARWLGDPADRRPLVVTGQAGSGKTALLGLLATLSDPDRADSVPRSELPAGFTIPRGVITEAIYAGTMTAGQVRDQIAAVAGESVGSTAELIDALTRHRGHTMTVLIDALDEAADPSDLARRLLKTLVRDYRGALRLLLGTRPGLLTDQFLGEPEAGHYLLIDLDGPEYADPASMRAYIRRILLSEDPLDSAYQPSGAYQTAPGATLDAVIDAIGAAAGTSFLVARITAATEATRTSLSDRHDEAWQRALPRRAGPAMHRDLQLRLGEDADKAARLLLPLAYAQGSGLPWEDVWPRLADALSPGHGYGDDDLVWLRKTAGSYAVEGAADYGSAYRLYHRALAGYLLEGRDQQADQQVITSSLIRLVPAGRSAPDWRSAHPYIRAHLATHAAQAGRIDDLLTDPAYLLAADRPQLLAATAYARSRPARAAADAYQRAARHLRSAQTREHASYLQLAARCGRAPQLADALEACRPRDSWSCTWASWRLEPPHRALTGHDGPVHAVTTATRNGDPVVISGGNDSSLRIWNLATGRPVADPLTGHDGPVRAVTTATLDGQPVAISGSSDRTVRVWDLATGQPVRASFAGSTGRIYAVTTATLDGRPVVVSGGDDGSARSWDLATGAPIGDPFTGHAGPVRAVTTATLDGRPVVISGGGDGSVRVWDFAVSAPVRDPFTGHGGPVRAVTTATLDDRPVAISGSDDQTVRIWDLATGDPVRGPFTGHDGPVHAVTTATLNGQPVAISGADDGSLRVWDLATGQPRGDPLTGHTDRVYALTTATLNGQPVVVSGGGDGSVRVWDLATGAAIGDPFTGHAGPVRAVTTATLDQRPVAISGG
ncbi:MAG TPA: WD40 repeat domain-containing protein, partial [Nakamurella sp.]